MDARLGGKISVLNGAGDLSIGNKTLGAGVAASGDALSADAYAAFIFRPSQGALGFRAGGEAAVLSGGASVNFNLFGYNIQVGVEKSAISAGIKVEFVVKDVQIKGRIQSCSRSWWRNKFSNW